MLAFSFVRGTAPEKWCNRYRERHDTTLRSFVSDDPFSELVEGRCDMALVRLPDERIDPEIHHRVVLYAESPGIAVSKDSIYAELGEALPFSEVAAEPVNYRAVDDAGAATAIDIPAFRDALQVVAANVGVCLGPLPLIKQAGGKAIRGLEWVDGPEYLVALVWKKAADCESIQDFVAITRGRKAGSSRGQNPQSAAKKPSGHKKTPGVKAGSRGSRKPVKGAGRGAATRKPRRRSR